MIPSAAQPNAACSPRTIGRAALVFVLPGRLRSWFSYALTLLKARQQIIVLGMFLGWIGIRDAGHVLMSIVLEMASSNVSLYAYL
jgi:hypothetical protein